MGNEAGDLDTIASSVAYSYLSQRQKSHPTIALIQMPRADLSLRPENLLAFKYANLSPAHDDLFMLDDLPVPTDTLKTTFALVDHNRLGSPFPSTGTVVGVIDHHADEGLYPDADPRDIILVGSASSLVARHFKDAWTSLDPPPPPEVATLLLSAIFIDTGGLKPKGKAEKIDHESAEFLLPLSTFSPSHAHSDGSIGTASAPPSIADITEELSTQKADVSRLDSRDLLRRDYKEFVVSGTRVGLSTVPLGPKPWLEKDPELGRALDAWAEERKLDVAGVLVTYRTEKKNKKRRGIILWVRPGEEALAKKLEKGLEKNKELDLDPMKGAMGLAEAGRRVKVWDQLNTDATRKVVAPAIQAILEA
ncbi:hypothetical protein BOTBODRAFT_607928 [Botryobasidium botryosum FD-172 SS1]|uniref:DHHA2 domain-containing protein n=1 Tax=Botryobasidium botryosum (strain FD-172 SS1) TaxID=930990 RepID=A0A067LWH6_BOTB1|nr:hypothetical protein BOTBODRAFT_607928 [Botryobasidium botryosum FD-172 SS1]